MPETIPFPWGVTGRTIYARIRSHAGQWWNGTAFDDYAVGDWDSYAVGMNEETGSGTYILVFPAGITLAGDFWLEFREQVTPGAGNMDPTDPVRGEGQVIWDGSVLSPIPLEGADGPIAFVYTVYQPDNVTPVPGATVWVSSDLAGDHTSRRKFSDDLGRVAFNLYPGPIYFWRHHPGFTFTNPDTEEVSA